MTIGIEDLFESNREALQLAWAAGHRGADRSIGQIAVDAADMVGHLNLIHPTRIQVCGQPEVAYFERLDSVRQSHLLQELVTGHPPAVIVADAITPPPALLQACETEGLPLFTTPVSAARLIDMLRVYLSKTFAQSTSMHGVFLDVLGMGVLISGESGLGKSELGLELISRGHGLVADDIVDFSRIGPNVIEGRCPPLLQNMLEVRGLGLLDIKTIFGETAVRRKMRLKLTVHLVRRSTMDNEYERLPLQALTEPVLGVPIRKVVIPVAAGRNLAVLTEAAVRNTILQLRGIDSTRNFMLRQRFEMDDSCASS